MNDWKEFISAIHQFMEEEGGYYYFKIGKSSESKDDIQKRYEKEFNCPVIVKILQKSSPESISELENKIIEYFQSSDSAEGLYLLNETSVSSGNTDADQLYVVRKDSNKIFK